MTAPTTASLEQQVAEALEPWVELDPAQDIPVVLHQLAKFNLKIVEMKDGE